MEENEISKKFMQLNKDYLDEYYSKQHAKEKIRKIEVIKDHLYTHGVKKTLEKGKMIFYYKFHKDLLRDKQVNYHEVPLEQYLVSNVHEKGRLAVYTAIFGNYDIISDPVYVSPLCDYYIFTDMEVPKDSIWHKIDVSDQKDLQELDSYHIAKYIKFMPHRFFKNYNYSLWVDGNVRIIGDVYPLLTAMGESKMAMFSHPSRNCVYTESRIVTYSLRADKKQVSMQMNYYKNKGFPEHYGMWEGSIILRSHHDEVINLMEAWWEQVNQYTMRDQLSLPYLLWENNLKIDYVKDLGENWRWNPRFRQEQHRRIVYQ